MLQDAENHEGENMEYYEQVARSADIKKIPEVYSYILLDSLACKRDDPFGYRKNKYTIIDDEIFVKDRED